MLQAPQPRVEQAQAACPPNLAPSSSATQTVANRTCSSASAMAASWRPKRSLRAVLRWIPAIVFLRSLAALRQGGVMGSGLVAGGVPGGAWGQAVRLGVGKRQG